VNPWGGALAGRAAYGGVVWFSCPHGR